ncbi:MAG: SDR family oxidoreductase [Pseudomonadota bacterium]
MKHGGVVLYPRASRTAGDCNMWRICRLLLILVSGTFAAMTPAQSAEPAPANAHSIVLITGSNRGIGLALASAYAKAGWEVIATCRDPAHATELVELAKANSNLKVEPLDVTNAASIDALVAKYRGQPIDVLVNNAGTSGNYQGQLLGSFDEAAFDEIMRVNAYAPLRVSSAFLENVQASRQKKIVAITSGRGSVSKPFLDNRAYFYDMSKAALNLGMRKFQENVRDKGVLVGIFAPGIVDTDLNHGLRNGVPAKRPLISTQESATGVVTLIANLSAANQDAYMNYNGEKFSW